MFRFMNARNSLMAIAFIGCIFLISACQPAKKKVTLTDEQVTEYWHTGKTLPVEVGEQYPPLMLKMENDKGFNVLIDVAHQCSFASLWGLGGRLQDMGFRTVTNQASLNTVLDPEGKSRVRIPYDAENKIFPFAWYPNFKYNVVITEQADLNAQHYTPEEQKALVEFVKKGGGLVVLGVPVKDEQKMKEWSLNGLIRQFDAELSAKSDRYRDRPYASLQLGKDWEALATGETGGVVMARRDFGKGRVVIAGNVDAIRRSGDDETYNQKSDSTAGVILDWVCEGQEPVGGEPRLPQPMGGGGAIYPELENVAGDIVVYYAQNQKENLLKTVQETFPAITQKIQGWLPSRPTKEPMYLILAAGDGGGWAVNAFQPKENGIISLSAEGLVSIYAHELAHTMSGPDNAEGFTAAVSKMPQRGEAHAGWFQGKIDAWYDSTRLGKSNRNCNWIFEQPYFNELDLTVYDENQELHEKFGKGKDWTKIWYIWQKMDDRYGTTWYPRWRWVQYTRWADDRDRRLTWEETVEDMSIAVGEDLFPFFRKIGIKLDRERIGKMSFDGKELNLEPTPLDATAAGNVRLDDIADYKKPLVY